MKYLLLVSLLIGILNADKMTKEELTRELHHLSMDQYLVLLKTYKKGKPFGYELAMSAIAWHESRFGKYLVNLAGPAFGPFHNLITSVVRRHDPGSIDNEWVRSRLAERLVLDYDFGFSESLAELKYWENYWTSKKVPKVWSHTISSYYAGVKWKNGAEYLKDIELKISILKKYIADHKELFDELDRIKL
jgi:hypothetical protein